MQAIPLSGQAKHHANGLALSAKGLQTQVLCSQYLPLSLRFIFSVLGANQGQQTSSVNNDIFAETNTLNSVSWL